MRYDLYYIKPCSMWLDLLILFETVRVMLGARGRDAVEEHAIEPRHGGPGPATPAAAPLTPAAGANTAGRTGGGGAGGRVGDQTAAGGEAGGGGGGGRRPASFVGFVLPGGSGGPQA